MSKNRKRSFGKYIVKSQEGKYLYIDTHLKTKPLKQKNPFYSIELESGKTHQHNDYFEGNGYPLDRLLTSRILNSEFFKNHAKEIYELIESEYQKELEEEKKKIKNKILRYFEGEN